MTDALGAKNPRREQILKEATRIFSEKTYHGTTLKDIADAVGMLKGSLYHYISSKDKLLSDIILEAAHTLNEDLVRVERSKLDPIERLRQIVKEHIKFNAIYREAGTLFLTEKNAISSLEMGELMKIFGRRDKLLTRTLSEAIKKGFYRPVNVRITSLAIVGMCNSVLFWIKPSGRSSYEEIADTFFKLIHDGLSVKS